MLERVKILLNKIVDWLVKYDNLQRMTEKTKSGWLISNVISFYLSEINGGLPRKVTTRAGHASLGWRGSIEAAKHRIVDQSLYENAIA